MIRDYFRGDIFFITEGAYTGSEQNAGRPGVIVSNDIGNKHSPNVEVVFLTSREKKAHAHPCGCDVQSPVYGSLREHSDSIERAA